MTDTAKPTYIIDNERVKVGDWVMEPDTKIGQHVHEYDYLVIGVSVGELTIAMESEDITFPVEPGVAVFGSAGDAHDVINKADGAVRFLEIDLK